jgi:hypothetical protein
MSLVFQNIDPPPHSPAGECVPPAFVGGRTHSSGGEGGWGSIFWKTRDIGLPSYSNNLSTGPTHFPLPLRVAKIHCKKKFAIFPSPAGMSLTKLSLGGKN